MSEPLDKRKTKWVTELIPDDWIWDEQHHDFIRVTNVRNLNYQRPALHLLCNYPPQLEAAVEVTTARGTKKYRDKEKVMVRG
jgi:hypothetical protein